MSVKSNIKVNKSNIERIDILKPDDESEFNNNLNYIMRYIYDYDTIDYNDYVSKEWKRKEKNDEFNLKSYEWIKNDSDSEEEEIEINPYKMFNPYIEDDIYNKDNSFIVEALQTFIETGIKNKKLFINVLNAYVERLKNENYSYEAIKNHLNEILICPIEYHKNIRFIDSEIIKAIENSKNRIDKFKEMRKYEQDNNNDFDNEDEEEDEE